MPTDTSLPPEQERRLRFWPDYAQAAGIPDTTDCRVRLADLRALLDAYDAARRDAERYRWAGGEVKTLPYTPAELRELGDTPGPFTVSAERLQATADRLEVLDHLLRACQWEGGTYREQAACPICRALRDDGKHKPTCPIAAAIDAAQEPPAGERNG
jgi:hypothetical protein